MKISKVALVGALAFSMTAGAKAQLASYDAAQLPTYHGQVHFFTLMPRGDTDGLVLTEGTKVKTPTHLSERGGDEHVEFHVEFDGSIRKTKPAKPHTKES